MAGRRTWLGAVALVALLSACSSGELVVGDSCEPTDFGRLHLAGVQGPVTFVLLRRNATDRQRAAITQRLRDAGSDQISHVTKLDKLPTPLAEAYVASGLSQRVGTQLTEHIIDLKGVNSAGWSADGSVCRQPPISR
jgi:hypothetical protein